MLTDEQIKDEASHHGFIGNTEKLVKFARAIEAEASAQDTALILQLVEALEGHQGNYKLTAREAEPVNDAITAALFRLLDSDLAKLTERGAKAWAGAVPLTDEWIRSRCKESWIFDTAKQWVRMTEAAHGIKGKTK